MNFALDATYSIGKHLSGVGVYSKRILHGLASSHPEHSYVWAYRAHKFRQGWTSERPDNVRAKPLFESRQIFAPDLFHGLNQRLPESRFRRTVCTFHDLFVLTSEFSTLDFRQRFAKQAREAAERADLITCVSRFTADQVAELLHVPQERLRVVHHGTDMPEAIDDSKREPVILHVGAIQSRKNILRLLSAFEVAAPDPWKLVLIGSDGYGAEEIHAHIAQSAVRERVITPGWLNDDTLHGWMSRASIFCFPSLGEGFGIPVLEAMAHGVPVITSNTTSLPEVCGGAGILVNPESEEEIAGALRLLTENAAERERLAALGLERAKAFPWSRAVESTWSVYQELL